MDWKNQIENNGPTQASFDAKIESGSTVSANTYMFNIIKSLNKMHKVLCATLEAGQLEQIFKEAFRTLVDEIDQFFG